jgi:methylphosphotriester-DNA--protein-cysteine methyltransferase
VVDVDDGTDLYAPRDCGNLRQVVSDASHYFGLHFSDPIQMPDLAVWLGTSLRCLDFSFDQIRGVTPVQALQDHRLNQLFMALTDHPRQGLGCAIRACGLSETPGVSELFEQEFGIDIPLFLHFSCRAADDRLFRLAHPEADALVLPP